MLYDAPLSAIKYFDSSISSSSKWVTLPVYFHFRWMEPNGHGVTWTHYVGLWALSVVLCRRKTKSDSLSLLSKIYSDFANRREEKITKQLLHQILCTLSDSIQDSYVYIGASSRRSLINFLSLCTVSTLWHLLYDFIELYDHREIC